MQASKQWHTCYKCGKTLSSNYSLWRHKKKCQSAATPSIDITATKICEKKAGEKQPHCDKIIHFDSDEFADGGEPKSQETLKKLYKLINKEVPEKKIGMGTATAIPSPAIGYVASSVPGVPGKQQQPSHNEIQKILKPIAPSSIAAAAPAKEAPARSTRKNVDDNPEELDEE